MSFPDPEFWSDLQRQTLEHYDEELLRQVASRLIKPRNYWPVEELIERSVGVLSNPVMLDRRIQELGVPGKHLLTVIGYSKQPLWEVGHLVEMMRALGYDDGLGPVLDLLHAGLLYPVAGPPLQPKPVEGLRSFEQWLTNTTSGTRVLTVPLIASRALAERSEFLTTMVPDLSIPGVEDGEQTRARDEPAPREADGLEWLLRLAALWQQVSSNPLRRTQQGGFFKRDHERLSQDPLLRVEGTEFSGGSGFAKPTGESTSESPTGLPDSGFLVFAWAEVIGLLQTREDEIHAGKLPDSWEDGLVSALEQLWIALPLVQGWNPHQGWHAGSAQGNPYPSAYLLTFLLLARLPEEGWLRISDLERWLRQHHPYWKESRSPDLSWVQRFLLGLAYPLRLIEVLPIADSSSNPQWKVRLSANGRWLMLLGDRPQLETGFTQTLLVQPNLEILAYRQGLTPALIGVLTRCASWKTLGAACTLQLEPETVYRALEQGVTFETIVQSLTQHSTRELPTAVLDSLRTWSDKRDRITVYPSATLMEFGSEEDLKEALARGLPAVRLADNLAVIAGEDAIDFRHFRLTGTRDYALPPEQCVTVADDGITLTVDASKADLLLDTELPRFAELLPRSSAHEKDKRYRLTPSSLTEARTAGMTLSTLERWFQQRTGEPLPPAARLLLTGAQLNPPRLQRYLVLHVQTEELADGLLQWPGTRSLIESRLGPTALVVPEEYVDVLRERLQEVGMQLEE